jgi:formyltetrahydrofolate deformylase
VLRTVKNTAILLIDSPDRKGLVAKISTFLYDHGANILHADQHRDNEAGLFFMRIEWELDSFALDDAAFRAAFEPLASELGLRWKVEYSRRLPRVAIFVSKYLHCLADLLQRQQSGELACSIPVVIGNHEQGRALAGFHGIPFHLIPVTAATKEQAEKEQLALLERFEVDLIVLARYMQVLSPNFVGRYHGRIINVHHSFLPAFSGARPYQAAYRRGVKLIGATSHYVSEILDDGPIIEQDVTRVSHRDQLDDLVQKGRDVERLVLSRAVRWHLDRRILLYENKTVIFD